jgi:hypothetical protein
MHCAHEGSPEETDGRARIGDPLQRRQGCGLYAVGPSPGAQPLSINSPACSKPSVRLASGSDSRPDGLY